MTSLYFFHFLFFLFDCVLSFWGGKAGERSERRTQVCQRPTGVLSRPPKIPLRWAFSGAPFLCGFQPFADNECWEMEAAAQADIYINQHAVSSLSLITSIGIGKRLPLAGIFIDQCAVSSSKTYVAMPHLFLQKQK